MEKKGLCSTCVNDKDCTFLQKLPVWQCEEFTGYPPRQTKIKLTKQKIEGEESIMKHKGLCSTCVNDKDCTYSRKFPVLQCEEFSVCECKPTKIKKTKREK